MRASSQKGSWGGACSSASKLSAPPEPRSDIEWLSIVGEGVDWVCREGDASACCSSSSRGKETMASISSRGLEGNNLVKMVLYCSMLEDSLSTNLCGPELVFFFTGAMQLGVGLTFDWERLSGQVSSNHRLRGAGTTGTDRTAGFHRSGFSGVCILHRHCSLIFGANQQSGWVFRSGPHLHWGSADRWRTGMCGTCWVVGSGTPGGQVTEQWRDDHAGRVYLGRHRRWRSQMGWADVVRR